MLILFNKYFQTLKLSLAIVTAIYIARFSFNVLGKSVNLRSRLERINEIVLAKDRNFPTPDKG